MVIYLFYIFWTPWSGRWLVFLTFYYCKEHFHYCLPGVCAGVLYSILDNVQYNTVEQQLPKNTKCILISP